MSEEKKPDPLDDLRKGLGLLLCAAKTVASELPKGRLDEVVASGVREVGRAVGSVASTIEREVFKTTKNASPAPAPVDREAPAPGSASTPPTEPAGTSSSSVTSSDAAKPDARPTEGDAKKPADEGVRVDRS